MAMLIVRLTEIENLRSPLRYQPKLFFSSPTTAVANLHGKNMAI